LCLSAVVELLHIHTCLKDKTDVNMQKEENGKFSHEKNREKQ